MPHEREPDDDRQSQLPGQRAEQADRADQLQQEARNGLERGNDLLLDGRSHLLQARGNLTGIEIMEKGEILPLHRLVALPLDGGRHADAERVRGQSVEQERGYRHGRKDQQAKESQKRPFVLQKCGSALLRDAVDDDGKPPDDRQIDGFHRHGGKRERDQYRPEHRDEVHENRHRPLGGQRPVGNFKWPDQIFEGTVDRV